MPFDHRMPMYRPMRDWDELFNGACSKMMNPFSTDIADNGDSFKLDAELPGFSKEDISIKVENDLLTISAEQHHEESEEKPNFIKKERYCGSYSRSFDLTGIDAEKIEASYNNGILSVTLPKLPEDIPVSKQIEIK